MLFEKIQVKSNADSDVYKLKDRYRKEWQDLNHSFYFAGNNLDQHILLLDKFMPGYVLDYNFTKNGFFIDYKILPGIPLRLCNYQAIKEDVINICIEHLKTTWPYAHFDWSKSNILVDHDSVHLIDWDNIQDYSKDFTLETMINRLIKKIEED